MAPSCVQDQLTRLFGPSATSETMSIAVALEVLAQDDFNFLPDQSLADQQLLSSCAPPALFPVRLLMKRSLKQTLNFLRDHSLADSSSAARAPHLLSFQ